MSTDKVQQNILILRKNLIQKFNFPKGSISLFIYINIFNHTW